MKFEAKMFGYLGVFLVIDIPVYWLLSKDTVGTTALSMAFGLCALVWFYLYFTAIRIGPRPEDRDDAEISEMAGELGFFSPHSWWPLFAAGSAAFAFMGIVFGWWLMLLRPPVPGVLGGGARVRVLPAGEQPVWGGGRGALNERSAVVELGPGLGGFSGARLFRVVRRVRPVRRSVGRSVGRRPRAAAAGPGAVTVEGFRIDASRRR